MVIISNYFPILKQKFNKILLFLIGILISLACPLFLLPILCVFLFRCGIILYVKKFKPNFGNIVELSSVVFTTDVECQPTVDSVVVPLFFKGRMNIDQLRRSIVNKIHQKEANGNDKYPELRQSLTSYFGYMFWKWDSNFNIENHVLYGYNTCLKMNEHSLNEAQAKLLRKPFEKHRSPWEVLLIPNYVPNNNEDLEPTSLVLIRFSHAITDGLSIIQVILGETKPQAASAKTVQTKLEHRKVDTLRKLWFMFTSLVLFPFQLSKLASTFDTKLLGNQIGDLKPQVVRTCKPIPIALIKELKNKHQSCFQGILLAAVSAGVRKLLLSSGIEVPISIHCMLPVAAVGHQDKLRNIMMYGFLRLPVGEKCSWRRLQDLTTQFRDLNKSRLPIQLFLIEKMYAVLPISIFRYLEEITFRSSGLFSSIAAPSELRNTYYNEHRWMGGGFALGYSRGHCWFNITSASFEDHISFQISHIDSALFKGNEDTLATGILEEINYYANNEFKC